MRMKVRTVVLFGILAALGGWRVADYFAEQAEKERLAAGSRAAAAEFEKHKKLHGDYAQQPRDDAARGVVPTGYPRPQSAWQATEKAFYQDLLSKGSFDVLVVPFQVQEFAVDRSSRSLMTAQLAMEIASGQKVRVPDPYLVARALGEGDRRLNAEEAYRLAERLGVRRIVWGFVGQMLQTPGTLRFTIQYKDRTGSGPFDRVFAAQSRSFEGIPFSDEQPPFLAYQSLLPEVLKVLGIQATTPVASAGAAEVALPASPLAIAGEAPDARRDAYYFQILAALSPFWAERVRERFNEKALLATLRMPSEAPGARYLKARALMQMGLRPAAINSLGKPETVEERLLAAMLQGDLPGMEKISAEIDAPPAALLARLDITAVRSLYGVATVERSKSEAERLKLPGETWQFLAGRAMTEWDPWQQYDNADLKGLLDHELPVAGATLQELVGAQAIAGDQIRLQAAVDLSVLDHRRRMLQTQAEKWCCAPLQPHPGVLDYLDLIEAMATDNLVRRANFLTNVQGSPDAGLQVILQLEGAYKDHPQFSVARSVAEAGLAMRADGVAREGYLKSAYANAVNAMYWEQGQTMTATTAFNAFIATGRSDYGFLDNFFTTDYPYRSFYPSWSAAGPDDSALNMRKGLKNSAFDAAPLREMYNLYVTVQKEPEKFAEVMRSIDGRFRGHPDVMVMRAETSAAKGESAQAATYYRESIAAQPGHWPSYMALGRLLFEDGATAEAAKVFQSYPGFRKGARENPVGLSNYASEAGSLFFWSGHYAQAKPLYRIGSDLRTGSESSMQCAIRIALLSGDYLGATRGSLERAQRYGSPYAYRDYLGMLHAMGYSKPAWEAFGALAVQMDRPQIWESALVGHRMAGLSEKQVAEWAAQDSMRLAGRAHGYSSTYLLRAGVTDRMPSAELAASIAKIERPVWRVDDGYGHIVRPSNDSQSELVLGPDAPGENLTLPGGVFQSSKKVQVKSDLVYFAEGYRAMRAGDFASASATLLEALTLYDTRDVEMGYLLPYLAFAAAKAGQSAAVDGILEKFSPEFRRFDYYLAKAALAGVGGKAADSIKYLELARYRRPFTEYRPLQSEYQLAEISEWLYESTRDIRFRDFAVTWARHVQTTEPSSAWAYAMEAKLTRNAQDRRHAIAMTYYLDKGSDRLKAIPASEVKAAVKEYAARNPFLKANAEATRGAI